ncbi:MAG: hypothetical protein QNJ55_10895 [Xenococcus sp. MO_188.B8]|nr:hypothetical protein [Xenococcus sp. MO_188.B8]
MNSESPIEITLTPEGTDLAVIVDFHDFIANEERLEQLTIRLLKEIRADFARVEVERLDVENLSEETQKEIGAPKGMGLLPGMLKAILKTPRTLTSLLSFLVNCLAQKAFVLKFKDKKKSIEIKISGVEESEMLVVLESASSMAQKFFESKNK